jgi:hypothetical protein
MAAVQHYVPRFILKNFSTGKKHKLWVYDKRSNRSFQTNIHNVAGETRFYEAKVGGGVLSIEEGLARMESLASPAIRRIVKARNLSSLTEEDRAVISVFVAVQMQRVPHMREQMLAIDAGFRKAFQQWGVDPSQVENYHPLNKESAKEVSILALARSAECAHHILNKTWLLFETNPANSFYLSDNPVVMQNQQERGPRGALGLAVPGIEIYLPIASTLSLGFYCRSYEERIERSLERYRAMVFANPAIRRKGLDPLLEWHTAIKKGLPLKSVPENVVNHNSLQVAQSERFVYSSTPTFSLIEEMLQEEPQYRSGPRPVVF